MNLKHIYLTLNELEYPEELSLPFSFHTRYVCNFIERALRPLKWATPEFDRICVEGRENAEAPCSVVPEHALLVPVGFNQEEYRNTDPANTHELFLGMLACGFTKCAASHHVPTEALGRIVDAFRAGNYINEWVHKTKLLRPVGLRATMSCSMTSQRFALRVKLERRQDIIFDEIILETLPDELVYTYMFKDVVARDGLVVVKDHFNKDLVKIDPKDMLLIRCTEQPPVVIPTTAMPLTEAVKLASTLDD